MRKARALRTIRKLKAQAQDETGTGLSDWEGEFLDSVETRIGTYGRAFADPEKGDRDSALSLLQARKLKEIGAKAAGEPPGPFKQQRPRKGLVRRKPIGARRDG
jgi:hypothetical protein